MKPGIKPATPGLQGKQFIHYTTAAPMCRISFMLSSGLSMKSFITLMPGELSLECVVFILLINVKIQTIVVILIFMRMINSMLNS